MKKTIKVKQSIRKGKVVKAHDRDIETGIAAHKVVRLSNSYNRSYHPDTKSIMDAVMKKFGFKNVEDAKKVALKNPDLKEQDKKISSAKKYKDGAGKRELKKSNLWSKDN